MARDAYAKKVGPCTQTCTQMFIATPQSSQTFKHSRKTHFSLTPLSGSRPQLIWANTSGDGWYKLGKLGNVSFSLVLSTWRISIPRYLAIHDVFKDIIETWIQFWLLGHGNCRVSSKVKRPSRASLYTKLCQVQKIRRRWYKAVKHVQVASLPDQVVLSRMFPCQVRKLGFLCAKLCQVR